MRQVCDPPGDTFGSVDECDIIPERRAQFDAINERLALKTSLQLLYDNRPSFVDVPLTGAPGTTYCFAAQAKDSVNNLGAETEVHYASSTEFYLRDNRDGRPWVLRARCSLDNHSFASGVVVGVDDRTGLLTARCQ